MTKILAILMISVSFSAWGQDLPEFYLMGGTQAPFNIGIGAGVVFEKKFGLEVSLVRTPQFYAEGLGNATSQITANEAYAELVEQALAENIGGRLMAAYYFGSNRAWSIELGGAYYSASGQAGIDSVLVATTGRDFSTLIGLLQAAGLSTDANLDSQLFIMDIAVGRQFQLVERLSLKVSGGVAKIMHSELQMSTALANFDNSPAGSALLDNTEADLEDILNSDVWSPVLNISVLFQF